MNAEYRSPKHPNEPAFDWLTFDDLQPTMDQTLQGSVAQYNPYAQVIVFVLLPSQTGNSIAIWRRKIAVPNNMRLAYSGKIKQALAALRKDYILHVDEYVSFFLWLTAYLTSRSCLGRQVVSQPLRWRIADAERRRLKGVGGRKCSLSSDSRDTCMYTFC